MKIEVARSMESAIACARLHEKRHTQNSKGLFFQDPSLLELGRINQSVYLSYLGLLRRTHNITHDFIFPTRHKAAGTSCSPLGIHDGSAKGRQLLHASRVQSAQTLLDGLALRTHCLG